MKDFEKILKEKLENFEMPYDASAWNAMQSKLGSNTAQPKNYKWLYLVAGICAVALSTAVFFYASESNSDNVEQVADKQSFKETQPNGKTEHTEEQLITSNKTEVNNLAELSSDANNPVAEVNRDMKDESSVDNTQENQENSRYITEENSGVEKKSTHTQTNLGNDVPDAEDVITSHERPTNKTYAEGSILSSKLCAGDALIITNQNEDETYVKARVNEEIFTLANNESIEITVDINTAVEFLDGNNEVLNSKPITVFALPNASFTYEANLIEKGVPVIFVETPSSIKPEWSINAKQATLLDDNHIAIFETGKNILSASFTDNNGCKSSVEKSINITEEYNLLAPTGFIPNSLRIENMFFMPFALEQRNTAFTMIIVSTQDGGIVFESNDATVKWDGIDKRTGALVDYNTPFVWQVKLENPLPNEKNTYKGSVQMLKTP